MAWPSTRYKTAAAGGAWTPDDFNGWEDQFLRAAGITADDLDPALAARLGISQSAASTGGAVARRATVLDTDTITTASQTPTQYGSTVVVSPANGTNALALVFLQVEMAAGTGTSGMVKVFAGNTEARGAGVTADGLTPAWTTQSTTSAIAIPISAATTFSTRYSSAVSGQSVQFRNRKLWALTLGF